jgi:3-deoxy-D-manno-octulosonate 8-phosphate phosphatase (KDO 8-P phosphatase)
MNYKVKLRGIRGFAFDVDGVFTTGSVMCLPDGDLIRTYNAKDGFGLRMAFMNYYKIAIISGGESESIKKRFMPTLANEVYMGSRNKVPTFLEFCKKYNLKPEEVAYVGDDLPDIPVLQICGLAVCPADAVEEVKAVCDYVSLYKGGKGCVRDLVEQVLKIQGKWEFNPNHYKDWREKRDEAFEEMYHQGKPAEE